MQACLCVQEKLGAMAVMPTLMIQGSKDETVPEDVDKEALLQRLAKAAGPHTSTAFIQDGVHDLTGREKEYVECVGRFLSSLAPA